LSWATVTVTHAYNKPHKIYTEYRQYQHASLHCTVKTVHKTVGIKSVQVGNSHLLLFSILMAAPMNEFLYLFNLNGLPEGNNSSSLLNVGWVIQNLMCLPDHTFFVQ